MSTASPCPVRQVHSTSGRLYLTVPEVVPCGPGFFKIRFELKHDRHLSLRRRNDGCAGRVWREDSQSGQVRPAAESDRRSIGIDSVGHWLVRYSLPQIQGFEGNPTVIKHFQRTIVRIGAA